MNEQVERVMDLAYRFTAERIDSDRSNTMDSNSRCVEAEAALRAAVEELADPKDRLRDAASRPEPAPAVRPLTDDGIDAMFEELHTLRDPPWVNWRRFARAIAAAQGTAIKAEQPNTDTVHLAAPIVESTAGSDERCSDHPDAPHGFDRNASHSADRYVCDCESWEPAPALMEQGWNAAIKCHTHWGMAGWSSHKDEFLSDARQRLQEGTSHG